ncbi:hypothetical protein [Devosia sp. SL43]|uniref:hypothetical protein n=1 Tax=Devosia sp. SL43 TaxID=2806348 RepID=UPI001F47B24E|nr:hypothetical protein [Devosia sp. SL43]UJW85068.1 hypothetical protein IM737_16910 [Devosia sp. SL43]
MKTASIVLAILVGAVGVMIAVTNKPTGFDRCVSIISGEIEDRALATAATVDPRDVEIEAARICAGAA